MSCLAPCLWLSSVLAAVGTFHIGRCAAKKIVSVCSATRLYLGTMQEPKSVLWEVGGREIQTISAGVCPLSLLFLP